MIEVGTKLGFKKNIPVKMDFWLGAEVVWVQSLKVY